MQGSAPESPPCGKPANPKGAVMMRALKLLVIAIALAAIVPCALYAQRGGGRPGGGGPGGEGRPEKKNDGSVYVPPPSRPSWLNENAHPKYIPGLPPGSPQYDWQRRNQYRDERRRNRGRGRWDGGWNFGSLAPRYYSRRDNSTWPQASVNFTWGLYGAYGRWRSNPAHGFADSRFGAMFSYVDQNIALKFSGQSKPSPKQVEYETLVLINNYVNENVETIAVSSDGSYFVMFRSSQGGEGQWVPTDVTSQGVQEAARQSSQY
jgi:hypothetical protein